MAAPDTPPWGQHLESSVTNMLLNGSFIHPLTTVSVITALFQVLFCAIALCFSHTEATEVSTIIMLFQTCVSSHVLFSLPGIAPLPWPGKIQPTLQSQVMGRLLQENLFWLRCLSLCIPSTCPEHRALTDLTTLHRNWRYPCVSPTVNT